MFLFFPSLYFCYFFELQSLITCLVVFVLFVTYVFRDVLLSIKFIAFGVFIYLFDCLIRYIFLVLRIGMFHVYPLLPFSHLLGDFLSKKKSLSWGCLIDFA